ncbi:hypothetical protein AK830_g4824 [Neonectria ditissima]|uniref:Infection structure specific protein n=1 Tax=Neonectria ditissima TaxID=78410 RepID=A0A0P7BM51_9HYPO|nr:hypothetical protein AK830_g4824 [Neonectria ditissima]
MRAHQILASGLSASVLAAGENALEQRDAAECSSVAIKLLPSLADVPTPDSALAEFIAEQTQLATATDGCEIPAVTGSLTSEYSSWVSELASWYEENTGAISSVLEACSDVPEIKSQFDQLPGALTVCSSLTWATETSSSSSDDDESDSDASSTASGNAAPRQTGMAVAAVAMAGMVIAGIQ